jgi:hypothetical protein
MQKFIRIKFEDRRPMGRPRNKMIEPDTGRHQEKRKESARNQKGKFVG